MKTYMYGYKNYSASAKLLARGLKVKRIRHKKSKFNGFPSKRVINWGSSHLPLEATKCVVVNQPSAVQIACNKVDFFNRMKEEGVRTPEYTTNKDEAFKWVMDGFTVFARTLIKSNSGKGIVPLEGNLKLEDIVEAPLYTKYKKKREEYRIHVFMNKVISTQRKTLPHGFDKEGCEVRIRSHDNGFVFVRNDDHEIPPSVLDIAIEAVRACDLDFGAVDVIWNAHEALAYVLEVNTAPGLTGTTLEDYIKAFGELKCV